MIGLNQIPEQRFTFSQECTSDSSPEKVILLLDVYDYTKEYLSKHGETLNIDKHNECVDTINNLIIQLNKQPKLIRDIQPSLNKALDLGRLLIYNFRNDIRDINNVHGVTATYVYKSDKELTGNECISSIKASVSSDNEGYKATRIMVEIQYVD